MSASGSAPPPTGVRVEGLDSIRFICAAWVMIGHLGPRPWHDSLGPSLLGLALRAFLGNLVSGPSAVIVFFVISGFCIHFPYRRATSVELFPFFARRHIRILLPVAASVLLARPLGLRLSVLDKGILWSLLCEEIYYTIYPLLLKARSRWGWPRMIALSFVAAYGVVLSNPVADDYPSYGPGLNWVLGLPCWLLGCHLAESWEEISARPAGSRIEIWGWRSGILALSMLACALRFHAGIGYPWTLDVFALIVAVWLRREMAWSRMVRPLHALELGGAFSFSIYLMHLAGRSLFQLLDQRWHLPYFAGWCGAIVLMLAVALVFFFVVERPSHRLARWVYRVLMARRSSAMPAAFAA